MREAVAVAVDIAVAVAVAVAVDVDVDVAVAVAVAVALALALAVRRFALAKALEDPEGGPHGCGPFFIGTRMSRMKNPCAGIERAGL
ncbi:hypothetical protein [Lysobacter sp. CA196]|uniref:hypothetical protein n=1 Tax=Lysobacter sp. CA196 TaxID=3455606 RepID=UPI003F8D2E7C